MHHSIRAVVDTYIHAPKLTYKQEVMRLYRRLLRLSMSWADGRENFIYLATDIRSQFDKCKHYAPDSAEALHHFRYGQKMLKEKAHPDPYIVNYMPGGSLFMRNPALPLEVVYPDGIPAGVSTRQLNIDMSNLDEGQKFANRVFVDSANKVYYIDK